MPTRKILLHITSGQQVAFYLLALVAMAVCAYGIFRRWKAWRGGKPLPPVTNWPGRFRILLDQTLAQRRVRRRRLAGGMHAGIFYGFLALFIGTTIVGIEHYGALLFGEHWFYKGAFYLLVKAALDCFGSGLLIALCVALWRRLITKPASLGNSPYDVGFLALCLAATVTGFLLEGAGIAADPTRLSFAGFSPVGLAVSQGFVGLSAGGYTAVWWVHIVLVLAVIAALPYGRRYHLFVIPVSVALQPERPMGVLEPIAMSEVEETGKIGLTELADLDFWQRLSLDGCMECGRCTDVCPANAVGKELNPKQIVLDIRRYIDNPRALTVNGEVISTDFISDESLWACTNCHACVNECPALIRHVDLIDGIRRFRVAEGRLTGSGAGMLRKLGSRENPWGLPASQRLDWAKSLEPPIEKATKDDNREVLFWVGCSGAFEPRAQKTVQAIAQLLQAAGVKFTVLGPKERCTGDAARRMGDEFLFQQLAEANIATLNGIEAKRIVTQCPHCLHTLKNEYGQFGGNYEVLHHTQLLSELVESGRLKLEPQTEGSVTYHDPCFLARVNGETEAPRKALRSSLQLPMLEPERNKDKTFCCGAGGGRMWMEEPTTQRPGNNRAQELIATGARTVAVGCPFCKVMIADSVAAVGGESPPEVVDVAELMLRALPRESSRVVSPP
ncbi:heterodisulfide reductase-related iron-sulfur binding cluster [Armatimonas sp.]|uniref:heterodisulfide reductase-related iron-sulfur binding cluster n=1 Tax=Armatimonas sp. TaxID=1872638 RepID=UPI0037511529